MFDAARAALERWEECKSALDRVQTKYPGSPWSDEAKLLLGVVHEKQNQHDAALALHTQVAARTAWEVAARAQFRIGACLAAQKKLPEAIQAYLAVGSKYPYPDHAAAGYLEAAKLHGTLRQFDERDRLLRSLIDSFPMSPAATAARELLNPKK